MKLYNVATLRKIFNSLPESQEFSEDNLVKFLEPYSDEYYIVDGQWKCCQKGKQPEGNIDRL